MPPRAALLLSDCGLWRDGLRPLSVVVSDRWLIDASNRLCDRIGVISDGHMKMIGTMDELRAATGKQRLREIFLELLGLPADV